MKRLLQILLVVLLTTAALAGCMHGDDGDGGPSPTPTATPGANNTTDPFANAKRPPIPVMKVSVDAEGAAVDGPPFAIKVGSSVNITFDGNGSSDPDGSIERFSWDIKTPSGKAVTSTNETFVLDLGKIKKEDFGVYRVSLRVLDDDGIINGTVRHFALDYLNTYTLDGMVGPGAAAREGSPQDRQAGDPVQGIRTGTFKLERFTVNENATAVHLNLTYTAGTGGAKMKIYLFDSSVNETAEETREKDPVKESESADSPISLSHVSDDPLVTGTWIVRVELDGARIDSYTLDVKVVYTPPAIPQPELGTGGDGNNTTASVSPLPVPSLPPVPGDEPASMRDGSA